MAAAGAAERPGRLRDRHRGGAAGSLAELGRALAAARKRAGLEDVPGRLSMHSLRHGFGSIVATELALAPQTMAELMGHTDGRFSLKAYVRDPREREAIVADVLERAAAAGIGG